MTTLIRGSFKNRELLLVNIIFQDFFEHYFLGSMINCDYETYLGRFIYTSSSCFGCVRKYCSWKVIGQNYVFFNSYWNSNYKTELKDNYWCNWFKTIYHLPLALPLLYYPYIFLPYTELRYNYLLTEKLNLVGQQIFPRVNRNDVWS